MIVQCPSCKTRFSVDAQQLQGVVKPRFHCSRCGHYFELSAQRQAEQLELISDEQTNINTEAPATSEPLSEKSDEISIIGNSKEKVQVKWPSKTGDMPLEVNVGSDTSSIQEAKQALRSKIAARSSQSVAFGNTLKKHDPSLEAETQNNPPVTVRPIEIPKQVIEKKVEIEGDPQETSLLKQEKEKCIKSKRSYSKIFSNSKLRALFSRDTLKNQFSTPNSQVESFEESHESNQINNFQPNAEIPETSSANEEACESNFSEHYNAHQYEVDFDNSDEAFAIPSSVINPWLLAVVIPLMCFTFIITTKNSWTSKEITFAFGNISGLINSNSMHKNIEISSPTAKYEKIRDNQSALVITGEMFNPSAIPAENVLLEASLFDQKNRLLTSLKIPSQNQIGSKGSLTSLTREEINNLQATLISGEPHLANSSKPFRIIFSNPPSNSSWFSVNAMNY